MLIARKNKDTGEIEYTGGTAVDEELSLASSNPVQNKVVTSKFSEVSEEINALKKSVSDGKKAVADALTGQGVTTATDAPFATMAENVETVGTNKYNAGKTDYEPTQATISDNGILTVKNNAGVTRLTKTFSNSYYKGKTDYKPTSATLDNNGYLEVKNNAGDALLAKTFTNSYYKGRKDGFDYLGELIFDRDMSFTHDYDLYTDTGKTVTVSGDYIYQIRVNNDRYVAFTGIGLVSTHWAIVICNNDYAKTVQVGIKVENGVVKVGTRRGGYAPSSLNVKVALIGVSYDKLYYW